MKIVKRNNDTNLVYKPSDSIFKDFWDFPSFGVLPPNFFDNSSSGDIWEEGGNLFVRTAVPNVKEENLRVTVDNDMVTIQGKSEEEKEESSSRKYYHKSMESSYEHSFRLPYQVDVEHSEAKLSDGVVTVKLPKAKEQRAKDIRIVK